MYVDCLGEALSSVSESCHFLKGKDREKCLYSHKQNCLPSIFIWSQLFWIRKLLFCWLLEESVLVDLPVYDFVSFGKTQMMWCKCILDNLSNWSPCEMCISCCVFDDQKKPLWFPYEKDVMNQGLTSAEEMGDIFTFICNAFIALSTLFLKPINNINHVVYHYTCVPKKKNCHQVVLKILFIVEGGLCNVWNISTEIPCRWQKLELRENAVYIQFLAKSFPGPKTLEYV